MAREQRTADDQFTDGFRADAEAVVLHFVVRVYCAIERHSWVHLRHASAHSLQCRKEREEQEAKAEAHERALRRELNICIEALDYQFSNRTNEVSFVTASRE